MASHMVRALPPRGDLVPESEKSFIFYFSFPISNNRQVPVHVKAGINACLEPPGSGILPVIPSMPPLYGAPVEHRIACSEASAGGDAPCCLGRPVKRIE